jgi:Leucine-rich repeat (LRR) protein
MKSFTLILSILIFLGTASTVTTATVDQEYKVGNDPNLKVLSTFPMPKEFSFGGLMEMDANNNLWVTGLESIKDEEGKRELKNRIAVFDTSKPGQPELLAIHDLPPASGGQFGFCNQYLYQVYNTSWKNIPEKNRKNIPHLMYGFTVYDVHDPLNPILVGKTEGMFNDFPLSHIDESTKSMYVFNNIESEIIAPGGIVFDQTSITKVSLEDPGNPKIISSKMLGINNKEIKSIDGNVFNAEIRGNYLLTLTQDKIYIFDISKNPLQLVAQYKGGITDFQDFCLAEEYLSRDDVYTFVSGRNMLFNYPKEIPDEKKSAFQDGIILFSLGSRDIGYSGYRIGSPQSEVRLPFSPWFIHSNGTLVYAGGNNEDYTGAYRGYAPSVPTTSQFMVVDFSTLSDPQFSGVLEFDGSITGMIIKENRAYLLLSSGKVPDTKQTLITLEISVKEGVFQRQYMTMEEMYPGYKEPEIIPNPIEDDLRDFIDKPTGQLTSADFKDIKTLDFKEKKLTDIEGLELCTDLEELDLSLCYLDDISQLSNLTKLKILNLTASKIKDIKQLENLVNLEELNLWQNQLTDISPLLNLPKLKKLNLSNNKSVDFTPLSKLTSLIDLKLTDNSIFQLPLLSDLKNLKSLNLLNNDLYKDDFIDDLPVSIENLELWSNNLRELHGLDRLKNLKTLGLHDNDFRDIGFLKDLKSLEKLDISSNKKLVDLTPLSSLTGLKNLNISELYIDDLSYIKELVNLEVLDVSHINDTPKKISDLRPISNLHKLQMFSAGDNEIESIKPLAELTELVTIDLRQNKIRNIDALINLTKLERLDLSENKISDISVISNLEKLKEIILNKNEIKTIESILNGKTSPDCTITIGENPIPDSQINLLRRKFVVFPNENEQNSLYNVISIASCEISYFADKGRYTKDIKEFTSGGYLINSGRTVEPTLDQILSRYDVALFDVKDKGFTIIIVPEKDVDGRIFGITQEGIVLEWIGDGTPDFTVTDLIGDNWKRWPAESRFSVQSCGSGG